MKALIIVSMTAWALVLMIGGPQSIAQDNCSEGPSRPPNTQTRDLDDDVKRWGVFCDQSSPDWEKEALLRCALTGGTPTYAKVHCYRNLLPDPTAAVFVLNLRFLFTPLTTCNNIPRTSRVQAIEFTMNKWYQSQRYEFALQWNNVGEGAPQWRYWDPHHPNGWVPISPPITQCLKGGIWHKLTLRGRIVNDRVHYDRFIIDNQVHILGITVDPKSTPGEEDRLAIGVQLDGNLRNDPYEVLLDAVHFFRGTLP